MSLKKKIKNEKKLDERVLEKSKAFVQVSKKRSA